MDFKKILKFEPINLTQILITIIVLLIVIYAFKSQLNEFFKTLKDRPITFQMSASKTTIKLDAPVIPELLSESVSNIEGSQEQLNQWEETVQHIDSIQGFQKLGFGDLYEKLSSLGSNEFAVINYSVNDPNKYYFKDESMLKYLSIASEKVRYLAFYENNEFSGAIKIQKVIAGLASKSEKFISFGDKIKNGKWEKFPGLISKNSSFTKTPSVKKLQEFLTTENLTEVPLIESNSLVGFLNYKSIASELYAQASDN